MGPIYDRKVIDASKHLRVFKALAFFYSRVLSKMILTCIRKKIAEATLFSFTTIRTLANNRIKAQTAESIRSANFVGYKLGASSLQRTHQMVVLV